METEAQQVQHETCRVCSGTGWMAYAPCRVCGGSKMVQRLADSTWQKDRAELLERCRLLQEQVAALQSRLGEEGER
jgi:RecJ-like exonuclease